MPWICALSGEILDGSDNDDSNAVVVIPSGQVCRKTILLQKLSENGGRNPFDESQSLTEDDLIQVKSSSSVLPPRVHANSIPNLLQHLQKEYHALVLELHDTRQALENTRQELSQALYQNDAAVRVVARLAMERDQAREKLVLYSNNNNGNNNATNPSNNNSQPQIVVQDTAEVDERPIKKARTEDKDDLAIKDEDLQIMLNTWQSLHKGRKAILQKAVAQALTPEQISNLNEAPPTSQAWHATTCKGITHMVAYSNDNNKVKYIVTAGRDKQIIVFNVPENVIQHSFMASHKHTTSIAMDADYVLAGYANGTVQLWRQTTTTSGETLGSIELQFSAIVHVCMHPDNVHFVVACASGSLFILRWSSGDHELQIVGSLTATAAALSNANDNKDSVKDALYTCGVLHPDGLIYLAGTSAGTIEIWDLKSQTLASTMQQQQQQSDDSTTLDKVECIAISPNCYHVAAAHASGKVLVWDLRKQQCIATLNVVVAAAATSTEQQQQQQQYKELSSISDIAFDYSGKYIAYGGPEGVRIVTVKQWNSITASIDTTTSTSAIQWMENGLVVSSDKKREVLFYTNSVATEQS